MANWLVVEKQVKKRQEQLKELTGAVVVGNELTGAVVVGDELTGVVVTGDELKGASLMGTGVATADVGESVEDDTSYNGNVGYGRD